jgi:class 3 adenylate cyclase
LSNLRSVREQFLARYCREPRLLDSAIERLGLWSVREFQPGARICSVDDLAEACWLIVDGQVEISHQGRNVKFRGPGEMIGEQGFITTLLGREPGRRTADIVASGDVKLICFDASIQEKFEPAELAAWGITLAAVVSEKLAQSTRQRAGFRDAIVEREVLLERFAEGDALAIVRRAVEDESSPLVTRDAVIWFSDIANFSRWSVGQKPEDVAQLARTLTSCQIDLIRAAGGQIDKLIGDGVMALWFIDTAERRHRVPHQAVACAVAASKAAATILQERNLERDLGIRIGMHSGPVAYGDFGAKERIAVTVLGHHVNLASRFEQAKIAGLGPVRVSAVLKELVETGPTVGDWTFDGPTKVLVKHDHEIEIYVPLEKRSRP